MNSSDAAGDDADRSEHLPRRTKHLSGARDLFAGSFDRLGRLRRPARVAGVRCRLVGPRGALGLATFAILAAAFPVLGALAGFPLLGQATLFSFIVSPTVSPLRMSLYSLDNA